MYLIICILNVDSYGTVYALRNNYVSQHALNSQVKNKHFISFSLKYDTTPKLFLAMQMLTYY